jgi:hypothetical protein
MADTTSTRPTATLEVVTVRLPSLARDAENEFFSDAQGEAAFDASTEQA